MVLAVVFTPYRLSIRHGVLRVYDRDGGLTGEIPVSDLDMLVIIGRGVGLSSGLLLVLGRIDVPVVIHGRDSDVFLYRPYSVTLPLTRFNQYRVSRDPELSLIYSIYFIKGKLRGFKNLMKYLISKGIVGGCDEYLEGIDNALEKVNSVESIDRLRNVEAEGSRSFWRCISGLFEKYDFPGRIPRNRDVVNRSIDYAYSILYGYIFHALIAAGLDPYAGFMHNLRSGRPSLVYDFSEQYKPFIIHTVIYSVNRLKDPKITEEGLLDPQSISYISKIIHSWINKRRRNIGSSIRRNIYLKASELAEDLRSGVPYDPFIYRIW